VTMATVSMKNFGRGSKKKAPSFIEKRLAETIIGRNFSRLIS
jgi:hypothetical protein